jgi:hypothetical protein
MIPHRLGIRLQAGLAGATFFLAALFLVSQRPVTGLTADTLPASLSNAEFWELTERLSEPGGFFRSNSGSTDNLLSNEVRLSVVAAELSARVKPSGVYLGVGPEQNFTYITAIRPRIAFITDIRRGNLHLHVLYKALFEMSENRAEFVGRLFNRRRPAGLGNRSSAAELMSAYLRAAPENDAAFNANLKAVSDYLITTRGLPLAASDLEGIEYVYRNFRRFGPGINYTSSSSGNSGAATYATLMASLDALGKERSYLASEDSFAFVRKMQNQNLIVPIVGDFAGRKALREVGAFVRSKGAIVSVFYVSNVEGYLESNGVWTQFCENVASMPLDALSIFIRPNRSGIGNNSMFGPMVNETRRCR